jgi:HK97 gp10 family phage protein
MAFTLKSNIPGLDKRLAQLSTVPARGASRKALRAGLTVIAKAAQVAAPTGKNTLQRRRSNPAVRLKKTVKVRNAKSGRHVTGMKVTVGAPHGHFVVLGTSPRRRARIGGFLKWRGSLQQRINRSTGSGAARANPFFRLTVISKSGEVRQVTIKTLSYEVEKAHLQGKK